MAFNKNQSTATSFHLSKQSNARANELNKFCKNKAFVSYSPYFSKEHTKKCKIFTEDGSHYGFSKF